jgi:hypothetical protein
MVWWKFGQVSRLPHLHEWVTFSTQPTRGAALFSCYQGSCGRSCKGHNAACSARSCQYLIPFPGTFPLHSSLLHFLSHIGGIFFANFLNSINHPIQLHRLLLEERSIRKSYQYGLDVRHLDQLEGFAAGRSDFGGAFDSLPDDLFLVSFATFQRTNAGNVFRPVVDSPLSRGEHTFGPL